MMHFTLLIVAPFVPQSVKQENASYLLRIGLSSCPATNSARLHSLATRLSTFHPATVLSKFTLPKKRLHNERRYRSYKGNCDTCLGFTGIQVSYSIVEPNVGYSHTILSERARLV